MTRRIIMRFIMISVSIVMMMWAIVKIITGNEISSSYPFFVTISFSVMVGVYVYYMLKTLQRNPTPLRFGLIGLPNSGKTVFLSVLFHEIQARNGDDVYFQPYGVETVEEVTRNVNRLSKGFWLPTTMPDSLFPFRANVRLSRGILTQRYTLEIGDYAGEHVYELNSTKPEWLHRSRYFDYICDADGLLLGVDGERLVDSIRENQSEMINNLIAALQVFLDSKEVPSGRKTSVPIAIVVLKSDLIKEDVVEKSELIGALDRLISICHNRCRNYKVFYVSAVGRVKENGAPPDVLSPYNISAPILWALKSSSK